MATTKNQATRRREQQKANRLARVRDALNIGDDLRHLHAAWDFWRSTLKRLPPQDRAAHRRRLAELLVNDALNEMDTQRHAQWGVAA